MCGKEGWVLGRELILCRRHNFLRHNRMPRPAKEWKMSSIISTIKFWCILKWQYSDSFLFCFFHSFITSVALSSSLHSGSDKFLFEHGLGDGRWGDVESIFVPMWWLCSRTKSSSFVTDVWVVIASYIYLIQRAIDLWINFYSFVHLSFDSVDGRAIFILWINWNIKTAAICGAWWA